MIKYIKKRNILLLFFLMACAFVSHAEENVKDLWWQFVNPPDSTRTKVWWFHGETETTKEGIDADLRSFKEKGVGGVVFYDQIHGSGEGATPSMSPEWWDMLKYAAAKAKEYGLSFEVAVGNGYVTGGPWITPELAMKKTAFVKKLISTDRDTTLQVNLKHPSDQFKDVALVMFPDKPSFAPLTVLEGTAVITSSDTVINIPLSNVATIRGISYSVSPRGKGSTASMNIPGSPSERYFGAGYKEYPPIGQLEFSEDGVNWEKVSDLLPVENAIGHKSSRRTISFPSKEARHFRLHIHDWNGNDPDYHSVKLSDVALHTRDVVDNLEVKTGLRTEITYPSATGGETGIVNPKDVMILESNIDSNGITSLNIPKGNWRVIRFGYMPTGARTKHGRKNLLGLEADVMSAEAARTHYANYFRPILDTLSIAGSRPSGMCMDSHEAGIQNWTKGFEDKFLNEHGYDLVAWLPAFAGYIVGSRSETDMVLSDFRKTVTSTIASEYYGTLADLCRHDSVDFTSQAMLNILTDNIAFRGNATKPQGEFWAYQKNGNYDCLDAASAAHLFGKNIASGEAFTDTPYSETWDELLRIANIAYCRGINEFVVCASSYQPWSDQKYDDCDSKHPYVFHRFHPRWDSSPAFWDYQARCANLLRKGRPVVDLLVYLGEEAPLKTYAFKLPEIPEGYNFDVCSYTVMKDRLSASDGNITSEGGMTYKAMVVPERTYISPDAAHILERLEADGAKIIRCDKGENVKESLLTAGIIADLSFTSANIPDDKTMFFHRQLPDSDIYFIYNHSDHPFEQEIGIRADGNIVEIWNPYSCEKEIIEDKVASDDDSSLRVNLSLPPYQSRFLIVN